MRKSLLVSVSCLALTACDLSPDYTLPDFAALTGFKEQAGAPAADVAPATDGAWRRADAKAQIEEFAWWRMFKDPALDALMEQSMQENPSLEVAQQRVASARAMADNANASLFPSIDIGFGPSRQKSSPASINANSPAAFQVNSTKPTTLYTAQGTITYDLDLFGKNRNAGRVAEFAADAEAANYRAARLGLQAEVAQAYFALAALRSEAAILAKTVESQKASLALIRKKQAVGAVDALAVSTAETNLAVTESEVATLAQQRAVQEHALAILVGTTPIQMATVSTATLASAPPAVPAGLPSALIERRPDIQSAQHRIASANARIGAARAAYFPNISLSAMGGFTSSELSDLFNWSNRTWMIGPLAGTVLTQPIFEGGRLSAAIAERDADFKGAVAEYRGSVLQAFREVEDQLSGLKNLRDQASASTTASKAAKRSHTIINARYKAGAASYLDYLEAERSLLAAERRDVQVMGNRYVTTVQLVRALGGSWEAPPQVIAPAAAPVVAPKVAPVVEPSPPTPTIAPEVIAPPVESPVPALEITPPPPTPSEEAMPADPEPLPPETLPENLGAEDAAESETSAPAWWKIWE